MGRWGGEGGKKGRGRGKGREGNILANIHSVKNMGHRKTFIKCQHEASQGKGKDGEGGYNIGTTNIGTKLVRGRRGRGL